MIQLIFPSSDNFIHAIFEITKKKEEKNVWLIKKKVSGLSPS